MSKQTIEVIILGRPYKLNVDEVEKSYILQAVDNINQQANQYRSSLNYHNPQDLLAMIALNECSEHIRLRASSEEERLRNETRIQNIEARLKNIDNALTEYLRLS